LTQTVIAQLSKAQVSNLVVVRSIFFTYTCKHVSYLFDYWINCIFRVFGFALPNRSLHAFGYMACAKTDPVFGLVVMFFYQTTFDHKSREFQLTSLFAR